MKQVPKTDRIKAQLGQALGDVNAVTDDLAVFEAVAVNTRPLLRRTGLHAGARIGPDVLSAMMAAANAGTRNIPLKIMHRDGGLPVGKVFAAAMKPAADGHTDLHAMFYLPKTETELVRKIDSNVVGEVSVGIKPTNLLCSDCGWNYNGDDATFDNVWDCTCANGHVIGKSGTHLKLHGLDDWAELSLVDRGAAHGANILSRPKMHMGSPDRVALRGFDDHLFALFASVEDTLPPKKETSPIMDYTEKFVALSSEHAVAQHELKAAKDAVTAKTTELAAANTQVADLTQRLAAANATDAMRAQSELAAAQGFISELLTASLLATGKPDTKIPELVSEKVALLRDARASLALVVPTGGASTSAGKGDPAKPAQNHAAFKRA